MLSNKMQSACKRQWRPCLYWVRRFTSSRQLLPRPTAKWQPGVYVSDSQDIYTNLALEDWLYRNINFTNSPMLLLWRNHPCVVIGRHQNPWLECSVNAASDLCVALARRNSGGGTVYHDLGNLNCTFFTDRKSYDRKKNAEFICTALNKRWDLRLGVGKRDTITSDGMYKVSGTASKLGHSSYHHCTILINVDTKNMSQLLYRNLVGVESKSTASVRSQVKNLININPSINTDDIVNTLAEEYASIHGLESGKIKTLAPDDSRLPGISKLREELTSWDWIFGRTPKFTIEVPITFEPPDGPIKRGMGHVEVYNGNITSVAVLSQDLQSFNPSLNALLEFFKDVPFHRDTVLFTIDRMKVEFPHLKLVNVVGCLVLQAVDQMYR